MRLVSEADQIAKANTDIQRATQGRQVLENALLKEYFIVARAALFERLTKTKPGETTEREHIYLELKEFDKFESNFNKVMEKGQMAESWLEKLKQKAKATLQRELNGGQS